MNATLFAHLQAHELLRQQLAGEFPGIDDQTLRDTVEGLTSLPDILASMVRSHLDDLSLLEALRTRISDMQERFARLEHRADKKRGFVAAVMERAGIRKLTEAD